MSTPLAKGVPRAKCNGKNYDLDASFASPGPWFDSETSSESKLMSMVTFIDRELTALGLKNLKREQDANSPGDVTKVSLASACVEALNRIEMSTKRNEEMQLAYKTLSSENALLVSQNKKLKSTVDCLERECAKFRETERRKLSESNKTQQKLNMEKQNSRKNQAAVQQKVSQLEHGLKKKEKEAQVLKEKVDSLLTNKLKPLQTQRSSSATSIQPASIEILNDNKPKRARWMIISDSCENCQKMETLTFVVSSLEEKQRVLLEENSELRNSFFKIEHKLHENNNIENEGAKELEEKEVPKSKFAEMPFDIIQEDLYKSIARRIDDLKCKTNRAESFHSHTTEAVISTTKLPKNETYPVHSILNRADNGSSVKLISERGSTLSNSLLTDDEDSS